MVQLEQRLRRAERQLSSERARASELQADLQSVSDDTLKKGDAPAATPTHDGVMYAPLDCADCCVTGYQQDRRQHW